MYFWCPGSRYRLFPGHVEGGEVAVLTELPVVQAQESQGRVGASEGFMVPSNLDQAMKVAEVLSQSNFVPQEFRGQPANILVAMQMGAEVGLAPLQAVQNICVINGRPTIYGDAFMALVQGSVLCEMYMEGFDESGQYGWAKTRRLGRAEVEQVFTIDMAKRAGLLSKKGPWVQYPERMCKIRARTWLCRDVYPDVLKGLSDARVLDRDMAEAEEGSSRSNYRHPAVKTLSAESAAHQEHCGTLRPSASKPAAKSSKAKKVEANDPDPPQIKLAVEMVIQSIADAQTMADLDEIRKDIRELPEEVIQGACLREAWKKRREELDSGGGKG
ncbi:MAG: transcriptional regulator [Candidatus Thiodiazotropha weberae]|nr:transcriptional regulator [Candidatus Thiodiazotropha weberae]